MKIPLGMLANFWIPQCCGLAYPQCCGRIPQPNGEAGSHRHILELYCAYAEQKVEDKIDGGDFSISKHLKGVFVKIYKFITLGIQLPNVPLGPFVFLEHKGIIYPGINDQMNSMRGLLNR